MSDETSQVTAPSEVTPKNVVTDVNQTENSDTTAQTSKEQSAPKLKNPLSELMNESQAPTAEKPNQGASDFNIDKIVVPEGFQIADGMKGKLLDVVNQHGFSQTQIQALVDLQIQSQQEALSAHFDSEQAKIAKYPTEEKQMAIKGIKRFIPQEFQDEYLGEDSVMTEPMMRLAVALGKASAEGGLVSAGVSESNEDKAIREAQKMFKTMN